ncbi:porin [Heterostelium album PN500]|uniref:Porin n=1 Tax=Heterostelium pallidum (strain ATCC 26659 / Pp 5 / PN500) TaxID=670386 RepID=D3BPY4_HETP5|nr:porin [Heterostelium album PN500]EFA76535.1 porin [Heterostelium album PN500]|eukprot:XP_020428667.1 porin [Heterostelium album PN500]
MSNPGIYADLVKVPSDLIKKDYPETQQIEITENLSGYPISIVGTVSRKTDGSITTSVNPKLNLDSRFKNAKISVTGDNSKFGKGEVTFENLAPGLKAVLTVSVEKQQITFSHKSGALSSKLTFSNSKIKPKTKKYNNNNNNNYNNTQSNILSQADTSKLVQSEFQYKKDNLALTAILRSNKKILTSAVFGFSNFALGLQANVNGEKQELEGLEATFLYKREGLLLAVSPKNKGQSLVFSAYDRVNAKLAIAADLAVDLQSPEKNPQFTIGSQYYVDSKSFIKAKVNGQGRIGLGYTVPVNNNTKLSVAFNINGKDLSAEGKHNFGFNLVLNF